MENQITQLQPKLLWHYFNEVLNIPRPSKHEEKMAAYLINFAKEKNLNVVQDKAGNVLITKPASKGFENLETTVLQSHLDMVCEKNSDKIHDFNNDPIEAHIEGEWVKANGTTLGADDGIGIAAALAILASNDVEHGPIECLFTADEETGLTGAFALEPTLLKGKYLLNLDSEDEEKFFLDFPVVKILLLNLALVRYKLQIQVKPTVVRLVDLIVAIQAMKLIKD